MEAKEFEKYKGKETFGRDDKAKRGEFVFDNGIVVGYAPDELFNGQCLLTKVKCDEDCFVLIDNGTIMSEDVEAGYSYLWCYERECKVMRENVKL